MAAWRVRVERKELVRGEIWEEKGRYRKKRGDIGRKGEMGSVLKPPDMQI